MVFIVKKVEKAGIKRGTKKGALEKCAWGKSVRKKCAQEKTSRKSTPTKKRNLKKTRSYKRKLILKAHFY